MPIFMKDYQGCVKGLEVESAMMGKKGGRVSTSGKMNPQYIGGGPKVNSLNCH